MFPGASPQTRLLVSGNAHHRGDSAAVQVVPLHHPFRLSFGGAKQVVWQRDSSFHTNSMTGQRLSTQVVAMVQPAAAPARASPDTRGWMPPPWIRSARGWVRSARTLPTASSALMMERRVYAYDGYMLELARSPGLPLLTLDARPGEVARQAGIALVEV